MRKWGHARSAALHVSRHGRRLVYALCSCGRLGLRCVALDGCGTSAESAVGVGEEFEFEFGAGSEQRVKETEQSHLR